MQQSSFVISPNSKIPFGRVYRGRRLRDCPSKYLEWVSNNLWNSDLHEYAYIARQLLDARRDDDEHVQDLEAEADEFLRQHGVDPDKL